MIVFLSDLYGGSILDKEITQKSGFVDKLQRGDEVMADRCFNIQEEVLILRSLNIQEEDLIIS